jgi:hypothetical protein
MSPNEYRDRVEDRTLEFLRTTPKQFLVDEDDFAKRLLG